MTLKELRLKRKLTQKQLGDLIGSDQRVIRDWELGTKRPNAESIEKVAKALKSPVSTILKIVNHPEKESA